MNRDEKVLAISIVIAVIIGVFMSEPAYIYIYGDHTEGYPRLYTSFPIDDPDYPEFDGLEYDKDVYLTNYNINGEWFCIGHLYIDNNASVVQGVPPDNLTSYMSFDFQKNGTVFANFQNRQRQHDYHIGADGRTIHISNGKSRMTVFDMNNNRVAVIFDSIPNYIHVFEIVR